MSDSHTLRLSLQNMSCASCVGRVERGLSGLPGVSDVHVNLASETAQAQFDAPGRISNIVEKLEEIGYPARTQSIRLNVASMSCASCVGRVDKALAAVDRYMEEGRTLAREITNRYGE